jgi:hypothetical protein
MLGKRLNLVKLAIASLAMGGLWGLLPETASAQTDQFDNQGMIFEVDTVVEFEFLQSNGAYQSTFGVMNLNTGEKTPLLVEVKPSDQFQDVNAPSQRREHLAPEDTKDFRGTPGNTVPDYLTEFTFKANTPYVLYLESWFDGRPTGILYSANSRNPGGNQQFLFDGNFAKLGDGGLLLRIDDTGSTLVKLGEQDDDFDDFIVGIGGYLACPF